MLFLLLIFIHLKNKNKAFRVILFNSSMVGKSIIFSYATSIPLEAGWEDVCLLSFHSFCFFHFPFHSLFVITIPLNFM